jgi:hypothetical protein
MVPLLFGNFSHPIDEVQRLAEIRKDEGTGDVVLVDHVPPGTSRCSDSRSLPLRAGTPPRQGTQFLLASDDMIQLQ